MDASSQGPLYTAEQIKIPPNLPDILKDFTKAAIRTQPEDILEWSAAYFEALEKGEIPPVKSRFETGVVSTGGLTKGRLATLHHQLRQFKVVPIQDLRKKWGQVGCSIANLDEIMSLADSPPDEVEWLKVLALACSSLQKDLPNALQTLCEIVTTDLEGGAARIPLDTFSYLYKFLAKTDGDIPDEQTDKVIKWLQNEADRFEGKIGPREFQHKNCPCLTGFPKPTK